MAWVLNDEEIETMLAADGEHRYAYFVHHVCETRRVWGLYGEGWASLCEGGKKYILFWPHEAYAARFKDAQWRAYEPQPIELDVFLERWVPGMKKEAIDPAVFPVRSGSTAVISVDDLEENIRHELDGHEHGTSCCAH